MQGSIVTDRRPRFPEVLTIRLAPGFIAALQQIADAEGIPLADLVRRALAARIDRRAPADEPAAAQPQPETRREQ